MAMRKNDSDFRAVVNAGLMEGIESGKYFEIYDKWFGAQGRAAVSHERGGAPVHDLPGRAEVAAA